MYLLLNYKIIQDKNLLFLDEIVPEETDNPQPVDNLDDDHLDPEHSHKELFQDESHLDLIADESQDLVPSPIPADQMKQVAKKLDFDQMTKHLDLEQRSTSKCQPVACSTEKKNKVKKPTLLKTQIIKSAQIKAVDLIPLRVPFFDFAPGRMIIAGLDVISTGNRTYLTEFKRIGDYHYT